LEYTEIWFPSGIFTFLFFISLFQWRIDELNQCWTFLSKWIECVANFTWLFCISISIFAFYITSKKF